MNRVKWERFKFYTLVALILASMAQVGILLNYQYHGFPNYFFGGLLKDKKSLDAPLARDDYFYPDRIIVSEGEDGSHWVIDKENSYHTNLFNDVKLYLVDILRMERIKSRQVMTLDQKAIEDLAGKYSISFEFEADISKELAAFFLNIKDISNNEISSIKKIIILPSADANSNCTIEIIDELNKKIYEYVMPFQETGIEEEYYNKLIEDFSKNDNLIDYALIKETQLPGDRLKFGSDILFVASNKYSTYNTIDCNPPQEFEIKNTDNSDKLLQELMDLADTVLVDQKSIYIPSVDVYGTAVFKNIDSTYKVHKDGLLEYSYFSPSKEETEKGGIVDSYIRTLKFMSNKIKLVDRKGAEIFLSGMEEQKDGYGYKFTFDYRVAGLPVLMAYQDNDKEENPLKNAIEIVATGNRVLSCRWIFKDFVIKGKNKYSLNIEDLLDNLYDEWTDKKGSMDIKNIEVCYKITGDKYIDIKPVWKLETVGTGDPYTVTMKTK